MDQEPKQQQKRSPLVLVLIIIIVVLVAAAAVLALGKFGEKEPAEVPLSDNSTPLIGYEEGVTVVDDPDALQKAVDEMYAKAEEMGVPLEYQNDAYSNDGEKFECYIANPSSAPYDVFISVYSNPELTEQLYLSGLIKPGNAKRDIYLEKRLDAGKHRVYVVYSQVEEDHATIHQQAVVTMDFTVAE